MEKENGGNGIFREKSLKRAASPEELNDYIRVTSPGVWLVFAGIIIFLLGIFGWAYFGQLETSLEVYGESDGGVFTGFVKSDTFLQLKEGMEAVYADSRGTVTKLSPYPKPAVEVVPIQLWETLGLQSDTPLYPVTCAVSMPDGSYNVRIVLEKIRPIDLLLN